MHLEIDDELFPARKSLVGLRFGDEHEFARAQVLIAENPALYREVYPIWSMIVVRRDDVDRFVAAGFHYAEVEQLDDEDLSPEDVARRDRALIDSWKPVLFSRPPQSE